MMSPHNSPQPTAQSLSQSQPQTLDAVLRKQLQAAHDLARILDQESAAIRARDAEALIDIAPLKLNGLNTLKTLEQSRTELEQAATDQDSGAVSSAADSLWNQVIEVIKVCDRKNQLNGAMLALRQEHVKRAMDLIAGRDMASTTYSPDGSTQSLSGNSSTSVSA